jgi:DNA polymerase III delta prime subunit
MSLEYQWVEKYRPAILKDLVLNEDIRSVISGFLKKKTICNLLLAGRAGIGKTTLAKIISNELNATLLYINASVDNNVETVRTKVKEFCDSVALDGLKIVILDEADSLSSNAGTGASAQGALRNIIETSSDDTRFILTCNYLNKIIEPIQSRCSPIKLRFTIDDVLKRCVTILQAEKVKFDAETLTEFAQEVIKRKLPDVRSIVNNLEQWSISGTLENKGSNESAEIEKIIEGIYKADNVLKIREFLISNEDKFSGDYEMLAKLLFEKYFDDAKGGKTQLVIAESMYRMAVCLDSEVQFYAMLLQIKK